MAPQSFQNNENYACKLNFNLAKPKHFATNMVLGTPHINGASTESRNAKEVVVGMLHKTDAVGDICEDGFIKEWWIHGTKTFPNGAVPFAKPSVLFLEVWH